MNERVRFAAMLFLLKVASALDFVQRIPLARRARTSLSPLRHP